ncbi:hypothetical protein AHAS_Ahas14G0122400 [Arachis hypogaea]
MSPGNKDITDVLLAIFSDRPLNPRDVMGDRWRTILTLGVAAVGAAGTKAKVEVVEVVALESGKKQKRAVEGSLGENLEEEGLIPSVMDWGFDAPSFIDQHLLPGIEDSFYDCNVTRQVKFIYRALLRSAVIVGKAEPMLTQVALLDSKLRQSQLAREQKRAADAESRVAAMLAKAETLKTEVAKLNKGKGGLLNDPKDAVSATVEALKAQVLVLAPDVDVSVMGAFRTIRDGEIVDLE